MFNFLFTTYQGTLKNPSENLPKFQFQNPQIQEIPKEEHIEEQDNTRVWKPLDIPPLQIMPEAPAKKQIGHTFNTNRDFANTLVTEYKKVLSEKGLDPFYAYILTAQAAFESGWGKHQAGLNNFGGIKSKVGSAKKTKEYDPNKGYYSTIQTFKDFNSITDYCRYVVNLLNKPMYNAFNKYAANAPHSFIRGIVDSGYATVKGEEARKYTDKVASIYNTILNYVQ